MSDASVSAHVLYTAPLPAPNPRRVHIFLREKGGALASLPAKNVQLAKAEQKGEEHMKRNVMGQVPTLAFPDGRHISESVAIARYLDALFPSPPLFGTDAYSRGAVDMWIRRAEMRVMGPLGQVWINSHPATAAYAEKFGLKRFPKFGEESRARYLQSLRWLDRLFAQAGEGTFLADVDNPGKDKVGFSMADIVLLTTVDFGTVAGVPVPEDLKALRAWHGMVSARPSVASEKPQTKL
ncbi:glutathione S-transferase [Hyaloraphidium curvatum]|nr:glutathione S-transferase [Hyaloraphidium curvatum]